MTRSHPIPSSALAALLACWALAPAAPAQEGRRGFGPRGPQFVSPEVASDGKVTFRVLAPKASAVRLDGGDMPGVGRGTDLTKGEEDVWAVTLGPIGAGAYRYRFDVDGVPTLDPRNPATSESNNNSWSLVLVPGSETMDARDVPHGAVSEVTYYSKPLQCLRRMHVYTPPGYASGTERYPVFYLLHGAFDCDDSWTSVGRAGFILDNLIAAGKAVPMIVVMPAGHTDRDGLGRPRQRDGGPGMDEFQADFVEAILPHVEGSYRVLTERRHRAIAGLSMGGAQTLNVAFAHLAKFASVGVFSSGVFGIAGGGRGGGGGGPSWEERNKAALDDAALKEGLELVWFATGKEDFLLETTRASVKMLESHAFKVEYHETDGGHTWIKWRDYLVDFAPRLFRDGAAAAAPPPAPAGETAGESKSKGEGKAAAAAPQASPPATSPTAPSTGAAGVWSAEFDTQIGPQKYVFTLAVDGKKVTGKARSEIAGETRDSELTEGTLSLPAEN